VDGKFTIAALDSIEVHKLGIELSGDQLLNWMVEVTKPSLGLVDCLRVDFASDDLNEKEYVLLTGIKKADFDELFALIEKEIRNSINRHPRNALGMLLMTLRLNLTQSFLAFLFKTEQPVVSSAINSVCLALEKKFVPLHLGYNQENLSRAQAVQNHSRKLFNELFGQNDDTLFIVADGTYIYIQQPTDFNLQRVTYSNHKYRNLEKLMILILPSGYILEAAGMYGADNDNNDAKILQHMLKSSPLLEFLNPNDHMIVDRGFRDCVDDLEDSGLQVLMPKLLQKQKKRTITVPDESVSVAPTRAKSKQQFSTADANESRKVN
jgi:hypothetical protein